MIQVGAFWLEPNTEIEVKNKAGVKVEHQTMKIGFR